ncbi:MAG: O-antigen ligase family protein [Atribacterota bacterium]
MKIPIKKRLILFILVFIFLINLSFKSGWDLWIQTITWFATAIVLSIIILPEFHISKIIKSPSVILIVSGIIIAKIFSALPAYSNISFYNNLSFLFIFISASTVINTENDKNNTIKILLILGLMCSVLDITYFLIWHINLFPNPNIKAGFLLIVIPFYIDRIFVCSNKKNRLFWLLLSTIVLVSFIKSKSSWGSIILIGIIIFYLQMKKKIKISPVLIFTIIILSGLLLFHQKNPNYLADRTEWLFAGVKMILNKPFTGFGPGTTPHILPFFTKPNNLSIYIHSYFIQFGAENGIITLTGILWLLFISIKKLFRSSHDQSKIVILSVLGVLVYNLFEYNLQIPLVAILFWFVLGSFIDVNNFKIKPPKVIPKIMFTVCSILFLALAIPNLYKPFSASRFFARGIYNLKNNNYKNAENKFNNALNIYPDYSLAYLGLAINNISNNNLNKAAINIKKSFPKLKNKMIYKAYMKGIEHLKQNNKELAKYKFIEVIKFRLTQYGLDPQYNTPNF